MRLIDADAFVKRFNNLCETDTDKQIACIVMGAIANEPTVDDKQIRTEVIDDLLKQVKKEEMWLFKVIGSNQNINIAFGGIYAKAEQLKEQKGE